MTQTGFVDFHTHTHLSDGYHTPDQLIKEAIMAGIRVLAITDHNTPTPNLSSLQEANPGIHLIPGCEISCIYHDVTLQKELHVIALGCDFSHPKLRSVLSQNTSFDRAIYINRILNRLHDYGIDIGTYEDLKTLYPETRHLGRKHIAIEMVKHRYVNSIKDAFDTYIGAFGQRLAYVKNSANYVSLETAVDAICAAGGIAILAHLFYYQLDCKQNRKLVSYFKQLAKDQGGIEVYYAGYSETQTDQLKQLASEFDLIPSAASDYHGTEAETLQHHFPYAVYQRMESLFRQ